jgi:hypothetical protein
MFSFKFNSQTVARMVFLLFIIIISVYFMFMNQRNNQPLPQVRERFTNEEGVVVEGEVSSSVTQEEAQDQLLPKDKESITKIIIEIYGELYKGDLKKSKPSQQAIDFYYDYTTKRSVTRSDLQDVIESSAPALEKTFNDGSAPNYTSATEIFGTEDDVVELFNEILFRNPDDVELYSFAKMLKQDKSFSIDKLKQLLYTSEEYKRLEKTQTNTAYSSLIGGVTDRQLTLIVTTIYGQVVGTQSIDADLLKFLKKKLIQFNLDEAVFTDFLKKYIANQPFVQSESRSSLQNGESKSNQSNAVTQEDLQNLRNSVLQEVKSSFANAPKADQNQQGYTDNKGQTQTAVQNPNRQVIEILLRTAKDDQKENYLDSQNVLDKIKEQASCVFDKNATDSQYSKPSQDAAQLFDQRNTEELKNACVRNKKYLDVDENMTLDPSLRWSVPQKRPPVCVGGANNYQPITDQSSLIGTLLQDAIASDSIIGKGDPAI